MTMSRGMLMGLVYCRSTTSILNAKPTQIGLNIQRFSEGIITLDVRFEEVYLFASEASVITQLVKDPLTLSGSRYKYKSSSNNEVS